MANSINEVVEKVYWNNVVSGDGSVEHLGDAKTGDALGDDETINLYLSEVKPVVTHLYVLLTIYDSSETIFFGDV